ncbi:MAG: rhodanese-like domain-containing protein [Pseudomonadota bacterium]|nr:rhodanese-like domain-containing protein [Pseudomonadota bacterium]
MRQMTAPELHAKLQAGEDQAFLLDVRESWEFDICRIDGARLIPMRQIPGACDQLDREQEIVVICHHGIRSQQVALYLEHKGFSQVINLQGGVAGWARDVDPAMPTY